MQAPLVSLSRIWFLLFLGLSLSFLFPVFLFSSILPNVTSFLDHDNILRSISRDREKNRDKPVDPGIEKQPSSRLVE